MLTNVYSGKCLTLYGKAGMFNTYVGLMAFRTALCVADLVVNAAKLAEEAAERFDLSC